jgi:hypothetical protein
MTSPRGPDPTSISQEALSAALRPIRAPWLDQAAIRAHVMYPEHVARAYSDRGRDDVLLPPFEVQVRPAGWQPPVRWGSDVDAFADAIDSRGFKRERRNETPQIQAVTTAAATLSRRDSDAGYFTVSFVSGGRTDVRSSSLRSWRSLSGY